MARAYGQDPATLAGVDTRADPWLAWQLRRAVFAFGSWFDRQREATVERPAPKDRRPTIRVPKYGEAQLLAMLGLGPDGQPAPAAGPDGAAPADALDAAARALLRGDGLADR